MRKIGAFLAIIICGVILVYSYTKWNEKLDAAGTETEEETAPAATESAESETPEEDFSSLELETLTANMDEQVQEVLYNRRDSGEKVQLLIAGSDAMESGDPGYAELLSDSLEEAYGDFIDIDQLSFNGNSGEFISEGTDLSAGYDVVLFEPFTLMNNGVVAIEAEREHIGEFFGEVREETEDAVLVLHPPQPIYGAQYYRTQVSALEEFASMNDYAYIDHWAEWPDTEDEALKEYLTEDGNPNNEGAVIWADALIAYFTGN